MIGCHGNRRPSGAKTDLECPIVKKNAIQIPELTAPAANASGFLLASLSKTPLVQLVFLGTFCAEAFPIKASDNTEVISGGLTR
jgi:hypothetical protein